MTSPIRSARSILTPIIALAVAATIGTAAIAAPVAAERPTVDIGAPAAGALLTDVSGQFPDNALTGGDLGVATALVADNAAIFTPDGTLAGPDGVQTFVESLAADYPDARFAVTRFQTIGSLLIFDWQGETDGTVVHSGRTLTTIEGGAITQIYFVDPNAVAPTQAVALASGPATGST